MSSNKELYLSWLTSNRLNDSEKRGIRSFSEEEIQKLFTLDGSEFQFGTSGIRELVGPGARQLNIHTCRVFAEAYSKFILLSGGEGRNILVGYDNREHSKLFAKSICRVLEHNGISTIVSSNSIATPMLAFYCKLKKFKGGIMITASHNPPEYNGIKLYESSGKQLSRESETKIRSLFSKPEDYLKTQWSKTKLNFLGEEYFNIYAIKLQKELRLRLGSFYPLGSIVIRTIPFLFSSHHGTSSKRMLALAIIFGSQKFKEFYWECMPTFLFPKTEITNPEDPKSFKDMEKEALGKDIDYLISHDPDSDRGAFAEYNGKEWYHFTGNEMSILLSSFLLKISKNPKYKVEIQYKYAITTYVSGDFLDKIIQLIDPTIKIKRTSTGFKNIGREMEYYSKMGEVLIGCEEAIGCSFFPSLSLEKDGFQQTALFMYMIGFLKLQSKKLITFLFELMWEAKTVWLGKTITFNLKTGKKEEIYKRLMNLSKSNEIIKLDNLSWKILNGEDEEIFKFEQMDKNDNWIKARFSGTENKFKLYFNFYSKISEEKTSSFKEKWESLVREKRAKLNYQISSLTKELKNLLIKE